MLAASGVPQSVEMLSEKKYNLQGAVPTRGWNIGNLRLCKGYTLAVVLEQLVAISYISLACKVGSSGDDHRLGRSLRTSVR